MAVPASFDWKKPDYAPVYAERTARLERLRSDPALLAGVKAHYAADNPVDFINDWGMTFDPRNAEIGLPTTVPFLLFPKQEEFIAWLLDLWRGREDGLAEKSRDMGVSWLCVAFACWMLLFKPGSVVGFGSRKEEYVDDLNDPKSLFWKARAFIKLLPIEFRPEGWDEKKHAPFMTISNPESGAVIVGEAGDNIGRGNRTSIYFKDESAFYQRPDAIDAALSQTSNCKVDVSTPNGEGNPFARKRKGGRVKVFTFHWKQDPRKGQEWYDKQVRDLDPVVLAQEVEISYSASVSNAYIPSTYVVEAQARGPADVEPSGPVRLGVDVARFGDDKTALTARDNRIVYPQVVWGKLDTMQTAGKVKDFVLTWNEANPSRPIEQIAVDVIGIGAGVVDRLNEFDELRGIQIVGVNSSIRMDDGRNYNLRARIWRDGKDWLDPKNGPVSVPNDSELQTDLTSLHYSYRGGLLLIESKEDAKKRGIKSPDRADSFMLTFAEPVAGSGLRLTPRSRNPRTV
ncbi:MAG: TerL protein [Ramlibacter sp.]|nr:TerL protein [Ramlibacter sp.]